MTSPLPQRGELIDTDGEALRQADQGLLAILNLVNDAYGWVAVLEVLRDHVIARYPSGLRYAAHLLKQKDPA